MTILNQFRPQRLLSVVGLLPAVVSALFLSLPAFAQNYKQTNLVTDDQASLASSGFSPAAFTDKNLINPWGLVITPSGEFWIANPGRAATGTLNSVPGTATAYDANGKPLRVVQIPQTSQTAGAGPTGIIYNSGSLVVDNLDGLISKWNTSDSSAQTVYNSTGSAYSGLAIGKYNSSTYFYAANFGNKKIDVLDKNFKLVSLPGNFTDPNLPAQYTPFNIQNIGGQLYVAYAVLRNDPDNEPLGSGFVDIFDTSGKFIKRLISGGQLASPWGIALAPKEFGEFSNALLVGNFNANPNYATINAFDPKTGQYLGTLKNAKGQSIELPDLWALTFNKNNNNALYFTAGIGDENHGLFGKIEVSVQGSDN
ncbi:MAG: TIGR03118 family protein [Stigonema ocellatum SAG 48.90 = DSM 106950]|nr:TIGR03118 family protein [Stigonema ocellatum SAG 48.90 = DSM 106950]